MDVSRKIVFIVGPTATGKTRLGLTLARYIPLEIISADSMQVYAGMNIGTAKATREERACVPHHLIDIRLPSEEFSAFDFRTEALKYIDDIQESSKLPLIIGGSGLYIKALIDGLKPYPPASRALREKYAALIRTEGREAAYALLKKCDHIAAQNIDSHNERRIIRALEICEQLGGPQSAHPHKEKSLTDLGYSYRMFGLMMKRDMLYEQVGKRVDGMIEAGLFDEVRSLKDALSITTRQAVGYKEIIAYLTGEYTKEKAIEYIKQNTRNLVKKQCTWFRKDKRIEWLDVGDCSGFDDLCKKVRDKISAWVAS